MLIVFVRNAFPPKRLSWSISNLVCKYHHEGCFRHGHHLPLGDQGQVGLQHGLLQLHEVNYSLPNLVCRQTGQKVALSGKKSFSNVPVWIFAAGHEAVGWSFDLLFFKFLRPRKFAEGHEAGGQGFDSPVRNLKGWECLQRVIRL